MRIKPLWVGLIILWLSLCVQASAVEMVGFDFQSLHSEMWNVIIVFTVMEALFVAGLFSLKYTRFLRTTAVVTLINIIMLAVSSPWLIEFNQCEIILTKWSFFAEVLVIVCEAKLILKAVKSKWFLKNEKEPIGTMFAVVVIACANIAKIHVGLVYISITMDRLCPQGLG